MRDLCFILLFNFRVVREILYKRLTFDQRDERDKVAKLGQRAPSKSNANSRSPRKKWEWSRRKREHETKFKKAVCKNFAFTLHVIGSHVNILSPRSSLSDLILTRSHDVWNRLKSKQYQ